MTDTDLSRQPRRHDDLTSSAPTTPLTRDGTGDFGYGWSFVNLQTNLQTNLPATGRRTYGVYNPFRDGTELYLTLPTGQRVRFTFAPTSFQVAGQTFYHPAWQADSGVTYTLAIDRHGADEVGQPLLRPGNRPAVQPRQPILRRAEPTRWSRRTARSTSSTPRATIIGEVTSTGAQLYISDSGITAANGQTIQFLRDAQGRITSIVTPDGQLVNYQYDAQGNFVVDAEREHRRLAALRLLAVRSAPPDRRRRAATATAWPSSPARPTTVLHPAPTSAMPRQFSGTDDQLRPRPPGPRIISPSASTRTN